MEKATSSRDAWVQPRWKRCNDRFIRMHMRRKNEISGDTKGPTPRGKSMERDMNGRLHEHQYQGRHLDGQPELSGHGVAGASAFAGSLAGLTLPELSIAKTR